MSEMQLREVAREFVASGEAYIPLPDQMPDRPTDEAVEMAHERFHAATDPEMKANIRCTLRDQRMALAAVA